MSEINKFKFKTVKGLTEEEIDRIFNNIDLGEVCRSAIDRPLTDNKTRLFSGSDTDDAYGITTIAWDIFEPVN